MEIARQLIGEVFMSGRFRIVCFLLRQGLGHVTTWLSASCTDLSTPRWSARSDAHLPQSESKRSPEVVSQDVRFVENGDVVLALPAPKHASCFEYGPAGFTGLFMPAPLNQMFHPFPCLVLVEVTHDSLPGDFCGTNHATPLWHIGVFGVDIIAGARRCTAATAPWTARGNPFSQSARSSSDKKG